MTGHTAKLFFLSKKVVSNAILEVSYVKGHLHIIKNFLVKFARNVHTYSFCPTKWTYAAYYTDTYVTQMD